MRGADNNSLRCRVQNIVRRSLDLGHGDGRRVGVALGMVVVVGPLPVCHLKTALAAGGTVAEHDVDFENSAIQSAALVVFLRDCHLTKGVLASVFRGGIIITRKVIIITGDIVGMVGNDILNGAIPVDVIVFHVAVITGAVGNLIPCGLTRATTPIHSRKAHLVHPNSDLRCGVLLIALGGVVVVGKDLLDPIVVSFPRGCVRIAVIRIPPPLHTKRNLSVERHTGHPRASCQVRWIAATETHHQISACPTDGSERQRIRRSGGLQQTERRCSLCIMSKDRVHILLERIVSTVPLRFARIHIKWGSRCAFILIGRRVLIVRVIRDTLQDGFQTVGIRVVGTTLTDERIPAARCDVSAQDPAIYGKGADGIGKDHHHDKQHSHCASCKAIFLCCFPHTLVSSLTL